MGRPDATAPGAGRGGSRPGRCAGERAGRGAAPVALAADALSFLWSAGWIAAIRAGEPPPARVAAEPLRTRIGAGLRFVFGDPLLRAIVSCGATAMLCYAAQAAIEVLFLLRVVRLPPGGIGLLFSAGSVGTILGALCAAPLTRRIGQGRALVLYVVRMSATMRTIMWGVTPLGAVLGGALGTWLGLRATLWCCAGGVLLSSVWLLRSPLRNPHADPAR